MSSCVCEEQNELVVRTGLELRLRRLDVEMMKRNKVFIIGGPSGVVYTMTDIFKFKRDDFYHKEGVKTYMNQVVWYSSILDIPKDDRSNGIIICYNEPSYSGRQCLYHLFGERLDLKPYHVFVEAMKNTQKNGDAIVFTAEEIMWFPGPKSEPTKTTESDTKSQLAVIAESLKTLTEAVNKLVLSS